MVLSRHYPALTWISEKFSDVTKRNLKPFFNLNKAEVPETWNEGTGIEKGGYENAPQWLRDQLWKQDLRKRQELGLEPVAS